MALEYLDNEYEKWMKDFMEDKEKSEQKIKLLQPDFRETKSYDGFAEFDFGLPIYKNNDTVVVEIDINKKKKSNRNRVF